MSDVELVISEAADKLRELFEWTVSARVVSLYAHGQTCWRCGSSAHATHVIRFSFSEEGGPGNPVIKSLCADIDGCRLREAVRNG